ncbi:MAG: single-stranded DNA-binding protein [Chloroflexi bacterium]|nr:MAG: single-stranded DNA-binding protein [Chloroflexota bacterium]
MSNLNKALLIGRLTKDPEMRYTPSGTAVTNFSIATNRWSSGPEGERKEFTDYHNIEDGQKRRTTEIIANDVQFLDSRSGGGGGPADGAPRSRPAQTDDVPAPDDAPRDVDPDEIPF